MGLDMYLIKRKKDSKNNIWNSNTELMYWRKANQIHKWFVDNVQDGVDDCGYYEVTKEKITELYEICKEVLVKTELADGTIISGYQFKNGIKEPIEEEGKVIVNPEVAEELLPTTSGFFFGSTDYDEYYFRDVEETKDKLEEILDTFDFENDYIEYTSSW